MRGAVKTVSYTAPSERKLFFEYYFDPLKGKQPKTRSYTYAFTPPGDIALLTLSVVRPKDATGFKLSPAPASTQVNAEGLTEDLYTVSNARAGVPLSIRVSYSRPTWTPQKPKPAAGAAGAQGQASGLPPQGASVPGAAGGPTAARSGETGLILIALAIAGGTIALLLQGRQRGQWAGSGNGRPRRAQPSSGQRSQGGKSRGAAAGKGRGGSRR